MVSFFHCTLFAALALFSLICIKAKPALFPPPLLPSCSLFSANSSRLSEKVPFSNVTLPIDQNTRNLTLFNLSFLTHQSLSFTFTSTSPDEDEARAPSLAFLLVRSPLLGAAAPRSMESMELSFTCIREDDCSPQKLPLHLCNPLPQQIETPVSWFSERDPSDSDAIHFKDAVSLTYDAAAAEIHLQAVFYSGGLKINQTFNLSTNHLLHDSPSTNNESTTLFVGYITSGQATINVTSEGGLAMMNSAPSPITMPLIDPVDYAKSNHKKMLVWPIVGVSILGLMSLALFITKCHDKRTSLACSHPAGHGAPPSSPPFSHPDSESSGTPMMWAPPLSPSSTDTSQNSGSSSWLKQPNPR